MNNQIQETKREETRRFQINEYIKSHPGTHFRKIKRDLNLAIGVIQYHLDRLEKNGLILSQRRGLYKRFYPSLGLDSDQREILGILFQPTERDILLYLIKRPNSNQKDLSNLIHISPGSISWHMKRLSRTGLLESRRVGGSTFYKVKGDHAKILTLLRSYQPAIWERWAERLAELITGS